MSKKKKISNIARVTSSMQVMTALHGTNPLSFLSGSKLRLWKGLMILNVLLTIAFVLVIKNRYNNDQIVTRISTNCQLNKIPFPAVSICNFNMVSYSESLSIIQILKSYNVTDDEIEKFLHNLPDLKDYSKSENIGNFTEILSIMRHHYFTVESLMEEVHQKCDKLLVYCEFNRKFKKCGDVFKLIKTYEGHCCAFNYAGLNDDSEVSESETDADIEYYDDQSEEEVKPNQRIIVTSESGRGSGLRVILNVEPNDYPNWFTVPYYGAKVLLSDPNDYPEITILYKFVSLSESLDIKVQPMVFQSDDDIRNISPERRACWFHDEASLEYTDRYSYETCKTECKMQSFLKYCGCVPYKYPIEKSTRICEFESLECLNNVTAYISEELRSCSPVCYMECRDKRYSITSDLTPFIPNMFPPSVTKDHNASHLSALQVYYARSSCNSYKLMLLMDFNYFIATYGGIFSLCFGASLLTICEIVYLLVSFILKFLNKNMLT